MTGSASTSISIFIRESDNQSNTMVKKEVESPGWANGSTTKSAQFYLPSNTKYDVGLEVEGDVAALGEYVYSDYGTIDSSSLRRVEMTGDIQITPLG